jgi:hypothetical protein
VVIWSMTILFFYYYSSLQHLYQLLFNGNLYSNVAKVEWKEIYRIVGDSKVLGLSPSGTLCESA